MDALLYIVNNRYNKKDMDIIKEASIMLEKVKKESYIDIYW